MAVCYNCVVRVSVRVRRCVFEDTPSQRALFSGHGSTRFKSRNLQTFWFQIGGKTRATKNESPAIREELNNLTQQGTTAKPIWWLSCLQAGIIR